MRILGLLYTTNWTRGFYCQDPKNAVLLRPVVLGVSRNTPIVLKGHHQDYTEWCQGELVIPRIEFQASPCKAYTLALVYLHTYMHASLAI